MNREDVLPASVVEPEVTEATPPRTARADGVNQRSGVDRRKFTWRTIAYSLTKPRRKRVNRAADRRSYHVDFHPTSTPWLCAGIVALAGIDSLITLYFYDIGVSQKNGLMLSVIDAGRGFYVALKLIGAGICALFLATASSVRVFGFLKASHVLFILFFGYLAVILNSLRFFL